MLIDMHVHEELYSPDGRMSLEEIVEEARQIGLDAVCITNHDNLKIKEYAEKYSKEVNFPIFVGVEYYSLDGDILAFGIDELPEGRIPAQEFIDFVNERNGICIAAHPFRNNNRGLEEKLDVVKGLAGIEVLNGSASMEANRKALEYCKRLGLQTTGASDAHNIIQLGRFATWIPVEVTNVDELVEAFRTVEFQPAILKGYIVTDNF